MKRAQHHRKCSFPLICASISSVVFILILFLARYKSSNSYLSTSTSIYFDSTVLPELPRFAYFISGTGGDGGRLTRLLQALYHPRNYYLLHLDFGASEIERLELVRFAKSEAVMRVYDNVMVMEKGNLVTSNGPTMMASVLHSIAILLKQGWKWDWFVNVGASDYPLMPQDDILHIFSYLPRDLNFIEHTSEIGVKEQQRARQLIIDPGLYHSRRSGVFWAKEKRSLPASFKLFTGSASVILSRSFLTFCILGWDNLPRTLLMYYTNFLSSQEGYFHTVLCNHKDYQNTTVNHDLHYTVIGDPPKVEPTNLTMEHFHDMVRSGAPFAHNIAEDDAALDKIDRELLKRSDGKFTPGAWCVGSYRMKNDPCVVYASVDAVRPSLSSKRLEKLVLEILDLQKFRSRQCK